MMGLPYIQILAQNLTDLTGRRIARGRLTVTATDQNDVPLSVMVPGAGLVVASCITVPVLNGAIGTLQLPDPSQTSPQNILYHFHLQDLASGTVVDFPLVVISGPTWSLDDYNPGLNKPTIPKVLIQGPQGPAGPGGLVSVQAGATISAFNAVAALNGQIVPGNASEQFFGCILGLALNSATAGQSVNVQFAGQVTFSGWNWTGNGPVFLDLNGQLTQTPPASGFALQMGVPLGATSVLLSMQPALLLA
jgi:hypothetical protein